MKRVLVLFILSVLTTAVFGQLSVGYHQSTLSFAEFSYEINDKVVPSLRVGTNTEFEDLVVELAGLYQFVNSGEYEVYVGGGLRFGSAESDIFLAIPVGINVFPFSSKGFGFHAELAPMFGDISWLRGSFGIRYRFNRAEE